MSEHGFGLVQPVFQETLCISQELDSKVTCHNVNQMTDRSIKMFLKFSS